MKKKLILICSLAILMFGIFFPFNNSSSNTQLIVAKADSIKTTLPEEYCMRDEYIVFAQHQDKHGYCWNFASSMAATTTIMKATNEYYDFSELWIGLASHKNSSSYKLGAGGSFSTHTSAMKNSGLMLESDLPYQTSYIASNENASDFYNFYKQYSSDDLSESLEYDSSTCNFSKTNVYKIKNHILNHGSVYLSFYFKQGFIEDNGVFHKVPNQKGTSSHHAVSVIGWDDNFEKEVYLDGYDDPVIYKGAWIILNSYTENNGRDGINLLFYEDTNISGVYGYKYVQDTQKDLYFYDKIESGYSYPINVKGKYYGDFKAEAGNTKQKNIFFDDVNLEYSYIISEGASIKSIDIYLDNVNVSNLFDININSNAKTFSITKDNANFGNYKVLVTYSNGTSTKTYLNNFFVTHGLIREEMEFSGASNEFGFNKGKDLEYYSHNQSNKNYVVYTNKLNGILSFNNQANSVYTETPINLKNIPYEITNGVGCWVTYTEETSSGYELEYNFYFEYCQDLTMQPVNVFYDLDGGINNPKNFSLELANSNNDLLLYEPTKEGYTFAGWYLDYGKGSRKLLKQGDTYSIDWEDIHHMDENPSLNALSYYKSHYNNSNTVFVYAHWEEDKYYEVNVSTTGNGTITPNNNILISSKDSVVYNIKPDTGWNLFEIAINGIKTSSDQLSDIIKNGLVIQNPTQDINIEATFIEGTLLILNIGENIKTAYLTTTLNGTLYEFFNGERIGNEFFAKNSRNEFTLIVETFDNTNNYTYLLENIEDYEALSNGIYTQSITISRPSAITEINIGNAVKKEIVPVDLTYNINSYTLDHFLSENKYASSGVKFGGNYLTGQVVYLFIKIPSKTDQYTYQAPADFEKVNGSLNKKQGTSDIETLLNPIINIGGMEISPSITNTSGGWYRKKIVIDPDNADLGTISVQRTTNLYTIYFKNWNGTTIYYSSYEYMSVPVYSYSQDGETINYPTRNSDRKYDYVFIGWDSFFSPVTSTKTYTAVYNKIPRQYSITVEETENGTISPNGTNSITCEDKHTYIFTPNEGYKIKDVKVDGISIGVVNNYTFANIDSSHTLKVEFELISYNINFTIEGNGNLVCENSLTEANYGEDREIIVLSNKGWKIANVYINGKKVEINENKIIISNINSNIELLVTFEEVDNYSTPLNYTCSILLLAIFIILSKKALHNGKLKTFRK